MKRKVENCSKINKWYIDEEKKYLRSVDMEIKTEGEMN